MSKTYIRKSTKLKDGSRMVTTRSMGEYAATGFLGMIAKLCILPFIWMFKAMYWICIGWWWKLIRRKKN